VAAIFALLVTKLPPNVDFDTAPWFASGARVMFVLTARVAIAPRQQQAAGVKRHGGRVARASLTARRAAERAAPAPAPATAAAAAAVSAANSAAEESEVPSSGASVAAAAAASKPSSEESEVPSHQRSFGAAVAVAAAGAEEVVYRQPARLPAAGGRGIRTAADTAGGADARCAR
jgi:hypothetical protein